MNDATDPVGGAISAARDAPDETAPPGLTSDIPEVEYDRPPPGAGHAPPPIGQIDWQAWAAADPDAARAAWEQLAAAQAAPEAEAEPDLEAAHAELARDIEGWSPELAADIAAYAQARGFTAEELAAVDDPREVKILHLAMLGEQALAQQAHERAFGRFRPPTTVGGRGHPHTLSDKTSADAWMQARRTQLRKKARG
jgi:hypothetical protein